MPTTNKTAAPITQPGEALSSLRIPNLLEYFGLWAMHEQTMFNVVEGINNMDIIAHVRADLPMPNSGRAQFDLANNGATAIVTVAGPIMKGDTSLLSNTSAVRTRQTLRSLSKMDSVKNIVMVFDSHGGTVAGIADLAAEVNRTKAIKPVIGYCEDACCSAAYYVAAQCGELYANENAMVGSIGVYTVLRDTSGMASRMGVKVHVVKYGDMKAIGEPGTEVTPEQIAKVQEFVNSQGALFMKAVARGRRMSQEKAMALADGRVYVGEEAKAVGLIDGVSSLDAILERAASMASNKRSTVHMSTANDVQGETLTVLQTAGGPANFADLKAACEGADPAFLCSQLEANATVAQATRAWMAELNKRNAAIKADAEAKAKELDELKAAPKFEKPKAQIELATKLPDAKAEDATGDPIAQWETAIAAQKARGRTGRAATSAIIAENPELHKQYLEAHNAKFGNAKGFASSRFAD